jgi:hypothetical protein
MGQIFSRPHRAQYRRPHWVVGVGHYSVTWLVSAPRNPPPEYRRMASHPALAAQIIRPGFVGMVLAHPPGITKTRCNIVRQNVLGFMYRV